MSPKEAPLIVSGGPLRDRGWICQEWLIGLLRQDYPADRLKIACLVNDSRDDTLEICRWFAAQFPDRVFVREQNFGCRVDNNIRAAERDYHQFANVRNAWLEWVRQEWNPEAYWPVDSDIVCHPEVLNRLAAHQVPLVSAMVENNFGAPEWHTNAMVWRDPQVGPDEFIRHIPEHAEEKGLLECDLTGCCFLIRREVIAAGVRYDYHPFGEDGPFCWAARQAGFKIFCDGGTRADHRMKPYRYDFRSDRQAALTLADYWEWRAHHARD